MNKAEILYIPLDRITLSPFNKRHHYSQTKLEELAESIRLVGVIEPCIIRLIDGEFYELVSGERRFKASQMAGKPEIPCILKELKDEQALEIQIMENSHREDIHPLDQAESFHLMVTKLNYTVADICQRMGLKPDFVYRRMKLLDLVPELQEMFFQETLDYSSARELSRLTEEGQNKCLTWMNQETETWSHKTLKVFIKDKITLDITKAPFDPKDEKLYPEAGSCAVCPKRSGFNQSLFSDIQNTDLCFDASCFKKKKTNFIALKIEELTTTKTPYKLLTSDYWLEDSVKKAWPGIVPSNECYIIRDSKDCGHSMIGLFVHGDREGQTIEICTSPSCPEHLGKNKAQVSQSYSGSGSTTNYKTGSPDRDDEEVVMDKVIAELKGDVYGYANGYKLGSIEFDAILLIAYNNLYTDTLEQFQTSVGWEKTPDELWYAIRNLDDDSKNHLFRIYILESLEDQFSDGSTQALKDIARFYNVPVDEFEAEVAQRRADRKAEAKKATETPRKQTKKEKALAAQAMANNPALSQATSEPRPSDTTLQRPEEYPGATVATFPDTTKAVRDALNDPTTGRKTKLKQTITQEA